MLNKTNFASKVFVWILAIVAIVFFGGWAITAWNPDINWSLQALGGIAAVIASVIGGAMMYAANDESDDLSKP